MPTEIELSYIAGLLDGEAYIGVKKTAAYKCQGRTTPGYHARIQVRMVDKAAIEFLSITMGGTFYREQARCKRGRPLYCWQASDALAAEILRAVLPYLRVKRNSADAVLSLRALQAEGQKHRTKITGYRIFPNSHGTPRRVANLSFSDEYVASCHAIYDRCKELNKVGV